MRAMGTIALAAAVAACGGPGDAPCSAELGPWGEMPDLDMHVGDTIETDLRDHFSPPGCLKVGWWDDNWLVRSAVRGTSGFRPRSRPTGAYTTSGRPGSTT